jgi:hypothetical protein
MKMWSRNNHRSIVIPFCLWTSTVFLLLPTTTVALPSILAGDRAQQLAGYRPQQLAEEEQQEAPSDAPSIGLRASEQQTSQLPSNTADAEDNWIEILQGDVFQQCDFDDGFDDGECISDGATFAAAMLDPAIVDVPLCSGFVYRPTFSTVLSGFDKTVRCAGECVIDGRDYQGGTSAFVSTGDSTLEFCGLIFQNFRQSVS